jgi:hypothetical protein
MAPNGSEGAELAQDDLVRRRRFSRSVHSLHNVSDFIPLVDVEKRMTIVEKRYNGRMNESFWRKICARVDPRHLIMSAIFHNSTHVLTASYSTARREVLGPSAASGDGARLMGGLCRIVLNRS